MPGDRIRVGPIELVSLLDGDETLGDPLEGSFPGVPAEAWASIKRDQPQLVGTTGAWRLRVRCTLLRAGGRTILVDTGVGPASAPAAAWFPTPGRLTAELAAAGVRPDEVDTVVLSHVHDDHTSGATAGSDPAFPNARHLLQAADLATLRADARAEEEDRVIYESSIRPLEVAGLLDTVEGDAEIAAGIRVRHAPGHTPGHQIVEVAAEGERLVISADAFNLPAQMSEPDWYSGTDRDPALANATRRSLLDELGGTDAIVAPSHFAEPFGRVATRADGGTAWEPLGR